MKKALVALVLAAALGFGVSQLAGAGTAKSTVNTWYVNDDTTGTGRCTTPDFSTIQQANNSPLVFANDQITVCPGAYGETTVTKLLNFKGPGKQADATQCQNSGANPFTDVSKFAVVTGGFNVDGIDNVRIQRFTLQDGTEGVHTTGSTDSLDVLKNVIQGNTNGLYLNGSAHMVDKNCIRNNNLAGGAAGSGIYSDQGLVTSTITNNTFVNNNDAGSGGGVNLPVTPLDQNAIDNNQSFGDANFVGVEGMTDSEIIGNKVKGSQGGGIYLAGANVRVKVAKNTVQNGGDDGIAFGNNTAANDSILVSDNTVTGNATQGIDSSTGPALVDSLIAQNIVTGNGAQGILIRGAASTNNGNFVYKNTVTGNGSPQCEDDSGGNTWYGNSPGCAV